MQPATRIEPPAWMVSPEVARIIDVLTDDGGPARFVGGCVRDAVLGWPVQDIDVATAVAPDAVMARLADAGIRGIGTGIAHGTVTAVLDGDGGGSGLRHVEITTLRRDVETFGRHARVAFTDDWAVDARRRDFTINALFCDPDGTVYDPTGGLDDLAARRVRFVGDARQRIREDALRLLRFFRFHAVYGQAPADGDAVAACTELADLLKTLSGERVAAELLKLLAAPDPAVVLSLMAGQGILQRILPCDVFLDRLAALTEVDAADGSGGDAVRRLAVALAAPAAEVATIAEDLRLSNDQRRRLRRLAEAAPRTWRMADARALLYRGGGAAYRDVIYRDWADARAHGRAGDDGHWRQLLALPDTWTVPVLPINGDDVLAAGVRRGDGVGAVLREVEAWWIDGGFAGDRAACLARLDEVVAGTAATGRAPTPP